MFFERLSSFLALAILVFMTSQTNALLCNPRNGSPPPANGLPLCSLPVADYVSGRAIPGSTVRTTGFPYWMNITKAREGQAFANKHIFFAALATIPGLITGLAIPDEARVLAFTGDAANASTGVKRYIATAAQMQVWMEDIFCAEELDNAVLTSIANVRKHHVKAASLANAVGLPYVDPTHYDSVTTDDVMWTALSADFAASGYTRRTWSAAYVAYDANATAVNQFVQGLVLSQFFGYVVMNPEAAYIWDASPAELEAFLHAWAVLGWCLGVDDEYNPALQPDAATAATYLQALMEEYVFPGWFQITKIDKVLVETALLNYWNQFFPGLLMRPLMTLFMRDFYNVPVTEMMKKLSLVDKLALIGYDTTFVPSTHIQLERDTLNLGLDNGLNLAIMGTFGPNVITYMDKAKYAFYPPVPTS